MSLPASSKLAVERRSHAAVFAALGDKPRLALVAKLCNGQPHAISQLTEDFTLSRQAVTKHLRVLESAGLVGSTRTGRENRFELKPGRIEEIKHYLELVSEQWEQALARLRSFVDAPPDSK